MAGENFIALESTSQEIKTAVAGVDTAVDGIAQTTTEIKEATDGITLSEASIKAVADEILAKIGLTNDSGGGTAEGSIFAKLNALLTQIASSGGVNLLPVKEVSREKYLKFNTTYYVYCTPASAATYPTVELEGSGDINVYIFDKQILSNDRSTYIPAYTILKIKVTNANSSYNPSAYIKNAFTLVLDI